ncbi:aldehyde dehydrogenase (NADP(+)) [Undibacterium sp. TS12]|uniref:aldehyde dehydrogenase (NADP(+)) n=1 Tax=Undibacterium sp. TS12 TaxID=2908202 RepID=UPI001F4CFB79|nr:aldehyde dehydrogenase (NADP(+)) [Undibacterium sp. TS12]MCH8617865.1 aldehyde dehydrogenase (NADP(+)) [Undibacterium sp. TS12]
MHITGQMLIGKKAVFGLAGNIKATDPSTNQEIEPVFGYATSTEVEQACGLAEQAFDTYRNTTLEQRARFLEAIAAGILDLGPALIERAAQETGLPVARLEGERGRTVNQLRLFAKVVRDGHWLAATIDAALPDRAPSRPDLRLQKIALGPVAVFGASNFPLAFSVAGGDTASALAAGCPVVVKAHNAHLGTSELVGRVIQRAVADYNLPEGVFSMLIGAGSQVGQQLVSHPAIKAVGFTGSRTGGLALVHTASQRKEPIPVYAEMSSINPVFLLEHALVTQGEQLARNFIDSLTLGAGQFCTNPGLVIAIESEASQAFLHQAAQALEDKHASTMLTPGIHQAYVKGSSRLADIAGLRLAGKGQAAGSPCAAQAMLSVCSGSTFLNTPALQEEIFGPSSIAILCKDFTEVLQVAASLEGQLTATVHATSEDHAQARKLLPVLERKAGRILFNGFPTGVEVAHAMVHGGPFPATSDSRTTSVGATAIERFLRPVCYQGIPAALLPTALQDDNPWQVTRMIDGKLTPA